MTDLSPEAKELVELARDEDSPTHADRARVRRALAATLAAGAVGSSKAAAAATKSAFGAGVGAKGTVATWLALGVVAGLAGSAAVFVGVPALKSSPAATAHAPVANKASTLAATRAATRAATTAANPSAATDTASATTQAAPQPSPTTHLVGSGAPAKISSSPDLTTPRTTNGASPPRRTAERAQPSTGTRTTTDATEQTGAGSLTATTEAAGSPPRAAAQAPSSLGAETTLLESARAALTRGDAAGSLTLLAQHERQYPAGALVEERLATRVFALCGAGRHADAARVAGQLLRLFPASPLRARVLDSCAYPHAN
jgi:hypothetical protein